MAYAPSVNKYDVVTPILSKAALVSGDSSVNEVSIQVHLKMEDKEHAEDDMIDANETPKPIEVEGYACGEFNKNVAAESAISSAKSKATAEINGIRYVEASVTSQHWQAVTVNGIRYVPENAPKIYNSAYSVLQDRQNAEAQGLHRGEISHASGSRFRGEPIMVYVGSGYRGYAVHVPILTTFHVLGSKRLEEAEDGSYCMTLPDEDPIQFERLLTYMYEGTWEPEAMTSCGGECRLVKGACTHWDNKKYMQLYATACKYGVYGLADKIASKLDLEESVLRFCEAFKDAYEKCPGDAGLRGLFQRSLLPVFENNLRNSLDVPQYDDWGNNKSLAVQLAELVSCGGEFAVDLMQAFAMAKESAIQAKVSESRPFGCKDWPISDVEKSDTWDCQPRADGDNGTGCWGETAIDSSTMVTWEEVKKIQGRLFDLEEMVAENGGTAIIREDVKNVQGRLRSLEDMVSNLQLSLGAKSAQTQHTGFSSAPTGNAQPSVPQGWGPSISLQQPSRLQPGFGHCAVDETEGPRYRASVKEQEARDKLIFHPLYQPSIQSEKYVGPASFGW